MSVIAYYSLSSFHESDLWFLASWESNFLAPKIPWINNQAIWLNIISLVGSFSAHIKNRTVNIIIRLNGTIILKIK